MQGSIESSDDYLLNSGINKIERRVPFVFSCQKNREKIACKFRDQSNWVQIALYIQESIESREEWLLYSGISRIKRRLYVIFKDQQDRVQVCLFYFGIDRIERRLPFILQRSIESGAYCLLYAGINRIEWWLLFEFRDQWNQEKSSFCIQRSNESREDCL